MSSEHEATFQAAAANPEVIEIGLARAQLDWFARRMGLVEPALHHRHLNAHLEAVERGDIRRLMIFEPPGHAKSTYASWLFPGWFIGRNPTLSLIAASHTTMFAARFGRKVRNLIAHPDWPFPEVRLSPSSQAADQWETADGGEYFAVGVGGAVTGRRADGAILDDPIKGREVADSQTQREALWEWYLSDFRTRLKPGAFIILIQTRWHEDDLAGRILPESYAGESGTIEARDGEKWEVISLPALAEADDALRRPLGAPLWPAWYGLDLLRQERVSQGQRNWAALYQQRPAPDEGAFFKREWLRWYDEQPKHLRIYAASDYAVTADGGDYTVHGVAGVDPDGDLYLLDWWRGQEASDLWVEVFLSLAKAWEPLEWGEEAGQIRRSLGPFILKRQMESQIYTFRRQYPSSADKPTRAQSIRGRMAMGKVYFPKGKPWVDQLVQELLTFPAARHDDQVDVLSLFGRMLDRMTSATVPAKPKPIDWGRTPTLNELLEEQENRQIRRI